MNKIEFLQHLHKVSIEESLCRSDLILLATIAQFQDKEGATISELESLIGVGYMKQKVYRLEKAGLVDSEIVPQSTGRPLKFSKLTHKAASIVAKLLQNQS
jgi:chromosome segregation and condensation protein ScpB